MSVKNKKVFKRNQSGQSMIESILVIFALSLMFFGLLGVVQMYITQLIFDYTAFNTARSAAVGFWGKPQADTRETEDGYLLRRCQNVSAIVASGKLIPEPGGVYNPLTQLYWERKKIPFYLQGLDGSVADGDIDHWRLNYEQWDTIGDVNPVESGDLVRVSCGRDFNYDILYGDTTDDGFQESDMAQRRRTNKVLFGFSDEFYIGADASIMNYYKDYLND